MFFFAGGGHHGLLRFVLLAFTLTPCIIHAQEPGAQRTVPPEDAPLNNLTRQQKEQLIRYLQSLPSSNGTDTKMVQASASTGSLKRGQEAFQAACTTCHDEKRSLEKSKDLPGWRATVQRMAAKQGADVASTDIEPIAAYLASCTNGPKPESTSAVVVQEEIKPRSSINAFGTISPLWRGGNSELQNNGFFPQAFVGMEWQSGGPLSARATMCTSCHGAGEPGFLNRLELVEAVARVDLTKWVDPNQCTGMKAAVEAGRIIVPFGAFSEQVNPGVYRTVSTPLIFNMGQRARDGALGDPVIPMPYSDEGIVGLFSIPLWEISSTNKVTASLQAYLVNGLSGNNDGIDYDRSRDYVDNNGRPAWGLRGTVGNQYLRFGGSYLTGRYSDSPNAEPFAGKLDYQLWGVDVTARYQRLIRFQAEYARRDTDRVFDAAIPSLFSEKVDGYYTELELRPYEDCPLSGLFRFDYMRRNSLLPTEDYVTGQFFARRLTAGINIELFKNSLLMIDYEHWMMPPGLKNVDAIGVRWAITF